MTMKAGFESLHQHSVVILSIENIVWTLTFVPWVFPVIEVRTQHQYNTPSTKFEPSVLACYLNHLPAPILLSVYIRGSRVQDDIMH